jgi:hypothetical protein
MAGFSRFYCKAAGFIGRLARHAAAVRGSRSRQRRWRVSTLNPEASGLNCRQKHEGSVKKRRDPRAVTF